MIAAVVASLACAAAQWAAPLGLFPLLVGAALGGVLVLAMRLMQIGHRPTIWIGTTVAIATLVVGQHFASYLQEKQHLIEMHKKLEEKIGSSLAVVAPEMLANRVPPVPNSFADYMRAQSETGRPITATITLRGYQAWASWALDSALQAVAACLIIAWSLRLPYCGRCGTWYRTVREGTLSQAAAVELVEAVAVTSLGEIESPHYSLQCCVGGCGPTRLTLSSRSASAIAWLSETARDRVTRIINSDHRQGFGTK